MASAAALSWLHRLTWTLIYGGLLMLAIGIATRRTDDALGWGLAVTGAVLALAGFILIGVRARLREPSSSPSKGRP